MADWEEILKKPLVSIPKQRIRIKKPKKIEQEDDCKRKLMEIGQRMLNVPLFDMEFKIRGEEWTSERVRTEETPDADSYSFDEGRHRGKLKVGTWLPTNDESLGGDETLGAIGYLRGADSDTDINELPEKVCCEALKHLKAASTGNVLSEQTIVGWTVGSRVKLETYGENPTVHRWNRGVYIKNAQVPMGGNVTIGMSLKFFIPFKNAIKDLREITKVFRECDRMFKGAVG